MNKYMEVAKQLAENNLVTNDGGPFGACVVKDNEIIGKGLNKVLSTNDPTAHAEILALRDACKKINSYDLSGCTLYTTSYPCPMCLSAIIWANIKEVYYGSTSEDVKNIGFRDKFIYDYIKNRESSKNTNEILNLECLDRDEVIKIFDQYMNKDDKMIY